MVQRQRDSITGFTYVFHFLQRGWNWFNDNLSYSAVSLQKIMQAAWKENTFERLL